MTGEEIRSLVSPYLTNVTMAEEANLLRAEYKLADSVAAVYYFEFSDTEIDFDIEQFQEDHISSDYYNHPGPLQWNHYLIFIRESGIVSQVQKNKIENDDIYTRKFIFTKDEVQKYFTYSFSNQLLDTDIVSVWKDKLRAVDLDEVYADTYYTEAIPRFISDDVQKEEIAEQSISTTSQNGLKLTKLSNITLRDDYRTHPKPQRSFDFKTANLIRGANGTGKTSLLTAIELVIAGKSIADPANPEPGNCIKAIYNDDPETADEYTPNNNAKYRLRDNAWYSSSYLTGNDLYRTFNRYNYFDSDAAYKLSFDEDNLQITKYLSAIALGPEFGRIQDRMLGFDERLGKELRLREKAIEDLSARKTDAQKIIDAIQLASDPKALFEIFTVYAREIGWKGALMTVLIDDTVHYDKAYQEAFAIVSILQELMESAKIGKPEQALAELASIQSARLQLSGAKQLYEQAQQRAGITKSKVEQIEKEIAILTRAKIFFDNPDSFDYAVIEENLSNLRSRILINQEIPDLFMQVSGSQFLKSTETFQTTKQGLDTAKEETAKKLRDAISNRDDLRKSLDQLEAVISDIKGLGQKYLTLDTESTFCPMCDATYPKEDLTKRILSLKTVSTENTGLQILNEQIVRLEGDFEIEKSKIEELNKIERIISKLIKPDKFATLAFTEIEQELLSAITNLKEDREQNILFEAQKNRLDQLGISKTQLLNTKIEFEAAFGDIAFAKSSMELFTAKYETVTGSIEGIKGTLNLDNEEEIRTLTDFNNLKVSLGIPPLEEEPERYLNFTEEKIKRIVNHVKTLEQYLTFKESDGLMDIKEKMTRLLSFFENYRKAYSEQSQIQVSTDTILSVNKEISELLPVVEKIRVASQVLQEILTSDNEEAVLGEFLRVNEKDIEEIFLSLHSPKEFTRIEFNYKSKTVHMHKRGVIEPFSLNKISTGQRSALALSIFLALHKKLNHGPKVLLFDDPVTYTDDLNILSFLDYLRNLVIKENRQLIFATANQKLAGLFEKKFAFLGNEMVLIPLERLE